MNFEENYKTMEPMKYWQPPKGDKIVHNVLTKEGNKDYISMQKYDGEWCMLIVTKDLIMFRSRSISKVTGAYGNKTELVPHLVEEAKKLPLGTVLLGELSFLDESTTAKDVGSILRCKPEKAISRQKDPNKRLYFRVFDCLSENYIDCKNLPFEKRLNKAFELVDSMNSKYFIKVKVLNNEFLEKEVEEIWSKGGEGALLVKKDLIYSPGSRTARASVKIKKNIGELECKVVDTIEPEKDYKGESEFWEYYEDNTPVTKPYYFKWKNGVIIDNKGTKVRVSSGLTDEDREWLATKEAFEKIENGELIAVVTGMEITSDGSIRHPALIRLRDDI